MRVPRPALALVVPATLALALAGCSSSSGSSEPGTAAIAVDATDTTCTLSTTSTPAGATTFTIKNNGSQLNEFYLYDESGSVIVAEAENIGPGLTKDLTFDLQQGTYTTSCRPNGTGVGIRASFAVAEGSAPPVAADKAAELAKATATYRAYIDGQLQALIPATQQFADAIAAGDLAKAKLLFPVARASYERIEPVAEAFADDDYKIDIREDGIEAGKPWTGWHAIEKILWVDGTTKGAEALATQLVADTKVLAGKAATLEITPSMIGNGASGLMTEVATGKITGEEDRYSHTDISDFVANVEGVKAAFQSLEQAATTADAALAQEIATKLSALETELAKLKLVDGTYPFYDELTKAQIQTLSNNVDAVSEPISKLTAAVVG